MPEFKRLPTQDELSKMLYQMQLGGKSQQDIINENLAKGTTVQAIPDNVFQKMAGGAQIAKEQVNKLGNASDVAKLFPGYTGQSQVSIPTGYSFAPKQSPTGEVLPQGLQTQQIPYGNILKAIKPADMLGITGAQQAYTDVGMGKAPSPMDVLDVAGLGVAGIGAGKGLLGVAKATKGLPVGMSIKDVSTPKVEILYKPESKFLYAKNEKGLVGGHINDNTLRITTAEVDEASRGKGIGTALYKKLIDDALSKGMQVVSDSTVEAPAVRVYESLKKQGYDVERLSGGKLEDGSLFGKDANNPVFKITSSPQMQSKIGGLLGADNNGIKDVSKTGLPSPQSLTMPNVPTVEQMKQFGRTEVVPLSKAVSFQSERNWDKFNVGKHPGDLVEGFGDKPLALRLETGEYVIYDGNHRTDLALQKGKTELPMHVIDVKSYDPSHAGRKPVPDKMSADDLLKLLLGN